ncbi:MAG: MATE family efflux transporter [Bacteroidales bacterium]|nr:MATE family efflux transporter [Bacteroidales bacterium]
MSQLTDISKINRHSFKAFINIIKQSISGTEYDYTNGSLPRAILLLSIPMVLEMVMESVFAIVDIYFVSRLGPEAVATVGLTESLINIIYALGVGFSIATTALISRRIGEKNHEKAAISAVQAIITGIVVSVLIAVPGIIFSKDLLKLMGASAAIYNEMHMYTAIMLGSNITIILLFIINAVFRSSGYPAISMRVLWIANLLNLVLDPILIFGLGPIPALGLEGAAIATTIGRGLAIIYQVYLLANGKQRLRILRRHLLINWQIILSVFRLSTGAVTQHLVSTLSWIGLVRIIAEFGSEVIAGYTIAIRVIIFVILPSLGISNAAATLVGQNLGAKQPFRAERSVWLAGKLNMLLLGVIGILFIVLPETILGLFLSETSVISSGSTGLQIISFGFVMYGLGMVLVESINGAGDTATPVKINILCFWIIEIPLAYMLAIYFGMQEKGVYYSIIIAESLMTLMALAIFKRGKWKLKQV